MGNVVEISAVKKKYGSKKQVFDGLNLTLESGKIIGLLGPNGSGKTTLIKLLAGLLKEDEGRITIGGHPVGSESKAIVSYLPERTYFNENLRVEQAVDLFKDFYEDFDETRAYEMLNLLKIDQKIHIKELSKGTKEKVQLIMVMSRRAKLYLLDEPIAGVDPAARDYILQTILTNFSPESSILISTHLIYDIENILDDVIFIKDGNIVCHEAADVLRTQKGQSIDEIFREVFRC
ncbi:MAG: ABC transporter ATP-binding protein [Lachnospiraceae bacterium]|nr:ABC transporter ATP-binding protein [Lachnospiraceae bacterium]